MEYFMLLNSLRENRYLYKLSVVRKVNKNNHMRKIVRFMKRVAISGLSTLLKCGISYMLASGNSPVDEAICGAWNFPGGPGT